MHKLILIGGMSTTGKSTTSQYIYNQLQLNNIPSIWLHEECSNHPIRQGEFELGDLHTQEGLRANLNEMLRRWKNLSDMVYTSEKVYVMEGCLFQMITRYLMNSCITKDELFEFYDTIMNYFAKLNPFIVRLYRPNPQKSYEAAYKVRGERWANYILSEEHLRACGFGNADEQYEAEKEYQQTSHEICVRMKNDVLEIDTTGEKWNVYITAILNKLDLKYIEPKAHILSNPAKYCGCYYQLIDGCEVCLEICFDESDNLLYYKGFFPKMPMRYLGDNTFELISWPIIFCFGEEKSKRTLFVSGGYDWEFDGISFVGKNNPSIL